MEIGYALLALVAIAHFWLQERNKRKISYTLHVQGHTEQAEVLDFSVVLYTDETEAQWEEKVNKCFAIQEKRRGFNNERMLNELAKEKEALFKAAKAAEPAQLKLKEG